MKIRKTFEKDKMFVSMLRNEEFKHISNVLSYLSSEISMLSFNSRKNGSLLMEQFQLSTTSSHLTVSTSVSISSSMVK